LGKATAPLSSATREFDEIISILKDRKEAGQRREAVGPIPALANKPVLTLIGPNRSIPAEVVALSPTDGAFNRAIAELQSALSTLKDGRRPKHQTPNDVCVVLWLRIGTKNALLGADLERDSGMTEGWQAILDSAERPPGRAEVFKVAHHGSENADPDRCWEELLHEQPTAIVTAYSPSKLPRQTDLARICERTRFIYLTSDPEKYSLPRRSSAVEKTLRELGVRRRAVTGSMGHVRVRVDASDSLAKPEVLVRTGARQHVCA
jgi:hypothetical protein